MPLPQTGWPDAGGQEGDGANDPETQRAVQDIIDGAQPWRQWAQDAQDAPAQEPDPAWMSQSPQEYFNENPPLDFHQDPEAAGAILPESPPLPYYHDRSHPEHQTRAAALLRVLAMGAMGGLAGAGAKNAGEGFRYGVQAAQNLQNLQARRQAAKDQSDWRRTQIERAQAQTAGIPQQQQDLSAYRSGRTAYLQAQTDKLKRAPNDKLLRSYNGDDKKVHFVFQSPAGDTYEKASDTSFYTKPEAQQKSPRPIVGHGHDGALYLIDPDTGHARKVLDGFSKPRVASPTYFERVDRWKNSEWTKINNNSLLSEDERLQRLQDAQDHYERAILTGGGSVEHYDVRIGATPGGGRAAPGRTGPNRDPLGIR